MCTENYDPWYPDQPVVDRYLPVWAKLPAFSSKSAFIWRATSSLLLELEAAAASAAATPSWCWPRQAPLRIPPIDDLLRAVSQTKPNAAVADAHYITKTTTTASGRLGATLRSLHWIAVDDLEREIRSGSGGVDVHLVLVTAGSAAHNARAARTSTRYSCGLMFLLLAVAAGANCVLASPAARASGSTSSRSSPPPARPRRVFHFPVLRPRRELHVRLHRVAL
ncbi:hypothetical protein PR202_ga06070 [Eleusine coracana subsp. coracana]|uniref:Uncharacterized protein n=1 Tax=Eleusine coracana subsp. coracana TaxID=191504 RepID=A0AAV5BU18_ELECO|nr:hypothetical protein PR202_ga06070 [Eleusine coracana subsp. coracana]